MTMLLCICFPCIVQCSCREIRFVEPRDRKPYYRLTAGTTMEYVGDAQRVPTEASGAHMSRIREEDH